MPEVKGVIPKSNVISFPEKEYILVCGECKSNEFYIILNSNDPLDFKYISCANCDIGGIDFTKKED